MDTERMSILELRLGRRRAVSGEQLAVRCCSESGPLAYLQPLELLVCDEVDGRQGLVLDSQGSLHVLWADAASERKRETLGNRSGQPLQATEPICCYSLP